MSSGSTSTVGGGANTGTANMWNQFLQQQLGGSGQTAINSMPIRQVTADGKPGQPMPSIGSSGIPGSNPFANAINHQLNQTTGGMMKDNPLLSQLGNMPQAPGFVDPGLSQYNTNAPNSDIYNTLFGTGGLGSNPNLNINTNQLMQQFQGMLNGGGGVGHAAQVQNAIGPNGIGSLLNPNTQSPLFQALTQQQNQQQALALANQHARFSQGGGGALGTGASFADAQLLSQLQPANMLAQGQLGMQQQGLDLQNRQGSADALLRQMGYNVDQRGQDTQANIAGAQIGSQNQLGLLDAMLRGQLGNQSTALGLLNTGQNAASNDAQNRLTGFDLSNRAVGYGNADQLAASGMHNTFNQNQFGQQSQNQLGLGQLGLGLQGQQQQGIQNILNQLFNSFNQSNQIGSPQSQTVQNPSPLGQTLGLLGTLSGIPGLGSLFGQGAFSGGGSQAATNPAGNNSLSNSYYKHNRLTL